VRNLALATLVAAAALLAPGAQADVKPKLQVGVGRADITPPTGYFMMGWVRSDARVIGQHTRLLPMFTGSSSSVVGNPSAALYAPPRVL
jgi:hypothetical protein